MTTENHTSTQNLNSPPNLDSDAANRKQAYTLIREFCDFKKEEKDLFKIEKQLEIVNTFIDKNQIDLYQCYNIVSFLKKNPSLEEFTHRLKFRDQIDIRKSQQSKVKYLIPIAVLPTILGIFLIILALASICLLPIFGPLIIPIMLACIFLGVASIILLPLLVYDKTVPFLESLYNLSVNNRYKENLGKPFSPLTNFFLDIIKPYDNLSSLFSDLLSPIRGLENIFQGVTGLIWSLFQFKNFTAKQQLVNFTHCSMCVIAGLFDILLFPLNLLVKLPIRCILTISNSFLENNISKNQHLKMVKQQAKTLSELLSDSSKSSDIQYEKVKKIHKYLKHSPVVVPDKKTNEQTCWKNYQSAFFKSPQEIDGKLQEYNDYIQNYLIR